MLIIKAEITSIGDAKGVTTVIGGAGVVDVELLVLELVTFPAFSVLVEEVLCPGVDVVVLLPRVVVVLLPGVVIVEGIVSTWMVGTRMEVRT